MSDASAPTVFVPIVRDDKGNEMFFRHKDFIGHDADEAFNIGLGASLYEFILARVKYQRVQQIDVKNISHVPARLGAFDVAIIAGPAYESALQPEDGQP